MSTNKVIVWRATFYRTNVHVNYVQIRPIYANQKTPLPSQLMSGPNLSSPLTIYEDPLFNGWKTPIPQSWYQSYNNKLLVSESGALLSSYSNVYSVGTAGVPAVMGDFVTTIYMGAITLVEYASTIDTVLFSAPSSVIAPPSGQPIPPVSPPVTTPPVTVLPTPTPGIWGGTQWDISLWQ
jgi:hypothetical protein